MSSLATARASPGSTGFVATLLVSKACAAHACHAAAQDDGRYSTNGVKGPTQDLTADLGSAGLQIAAFGQDNRGEVYVTALSGSVYRIDAE